MGYERVSRAAELHAAAPRRAAPRAPASQRLRRLDWSLHALASSASTISLFLKSPPR